MTRGPCLHRAGLRPYGAGPSKSGAASLVLFLLFLFSPYSSFAQDSEIEDESSLSSQSEANDYDEVQVENGNIEEDWDDVSGDEYDEESGSIPDYDSENENEIEGNNREPEWDEFEESGDEDEGSGDEDEASGDEYDYDYDYSREDYENEDDYEDFNVDYKEVELGYVPELTSRSVNLAVRPGDLAEFPCEARDADKFVRIWMKGDEMLFTGNIRLTEDPRLGLTGFGNTSLSLQDATVDDSGQYVCRIMVSQQLAVTHNLIVTDAFSIQAIPSEGVVMVPLASATQLGCRIIGEAGKDLITWTRDNTKFRSGSYSYKGQSLQIDNVTLEDAGYYYCAAEGVDGTTKAASIHVQVLFPPDILSLNKNILQTGRGFEIELTCIVGGEPRPRVQWYKGGEAVSLSGRLEAQRAGARNVLVIHNVEEEDYGRYMCYATNSLGTKQKFIEVLHEIRNDPNFAFPQNPGKGKGQKDMLLKNFKMLKKSYEQDHKALVNFRRKVESDLAAVKKDISARNNAASSADGAKDSFDNAILADLERIEAEFRGIQSSFRKHRTDFVTLERSTKDELQSVWDNINELQEVTNITTRNIEEIYDKDILRLQNFQNLAESDIGKIKMDLTGALQNGIGGSSRLDSDSKVVLSDIKSIVEKQAEEVRKMKNAGRNSLVVTQRVRDDVNTVFSDIDDLKKNKQSNLVEIEKLRRTLYRLENEQVEQNRIKIEDMNRKINHIETEYGRTAEVIQAQNDANNDGDKMKIMVSELHNLKSQVYFLQQSIVQMRTQVSPPGILTGVSSLPANAEIGPVYTTQNNQMADQLEIIKVQGDIEVLEGKVDGIAREFINKQCVSSIVFSQQREEFEIVHEALVDKISTMEEQLTAVREESNGMKLAVIGANAKLTKIAKNQEAADIASRRYNLIFNGMRKRRKLERPPHLEGLVKAFINEKLNLPDVRIESAVRIESDTERRPRPVRVRFGTLRERNSVLAAGRAGLQGPVRVRINEDFTPTVMFHRKMLAGFARRRSQQTKTKWALKDDRLYFNKKVYMYSEENNQVIAVSSIA